MSWTLPANCDGASLPEPLQSPIPNHANRRLRQSVYSIENTPRIQLLFLMPAHSSGPRTIGTPTDYRSAVLDSTWPLLRASLSFVQLLIVSFSANLNRITIPRTSSDTPDYWTHHHHTRLPSFCSALVTIVRRRRSISKPNPLSF